MRKTKLIAASHTATLPVLYRDVSVPVAPATSYRTLAHSSALSYGGGAAGMVEIQSKAVVASNRRRARIAVDVPSAELEQVVSIFVPRDEARQRLGDHDLLVRRVGGGSEWHKWYGLALCCSLLALYGRRPLPPRLLLLAEVDLNANLRNVPSQILQELAVDLAVGVVVSPLTIVLPSESIGLPPIRGVDVVPCSTFKEMIDRVWKRSA